LLRRMSLDLADSVAKVEKLKVPKIDVKAAATKKHCSKAL
jgi:hypothetical protein